MSLRIEKSYPVIGAAITAAAWCLVSPKLPEDEKEFLAAAISLGAVLTGFIATAKTILMALPSEGVAQALRSGVYWKRLIKYLAEALSGCLLFSVFSLFGFFLLTKDEITLPWWYGLAWSSLGVYALLAFYRVSRILFTIIGEPIPAPPPPPETKL